MNEKQKEKEGATVIYRPWITLRNGRRLYASTYGRRSGGS
jgi:hypothetical protein